MRRQILTGESLVVSACVLLLAILFWPMQSSDAPPEGRAAPAASVLPDGTQMG